MISAHLCVSRSRLSALLEAFAENLFETITTTLLCLPIVAVLHRMLDAIGVDETHLPEDKKLERFDSRSVTRSASFVGLGNTPLLPERRYSVRSASRTFPVRLKMRGMSFLCCSL